MNKVTDELLRLVADFKGEFTGAYNIREDGGCAGRQSTKNIKIESKTDKPGIDIRVAPGTKGEKVYIPACVTHSGVDDLVYNDFYIGEGADVVVVAGCGIHADGEEEARHNGIHRFFVGKGAKVVYEEKHVGTGASTGNRHIDPVTEAFLEEDSSLTMDTVQISGVDTTYRKTSARLAARAKLLVRERLMTNGAEAAKTEFTVYLEGEDSGADLVSRSVAKGRGHQEFVSRIVGTTRCTGHSECDAILADKATVVATPALEAAHLDASLIHEAAIGKIAGEQLMKLRTLGLTEEQAEEKIIAGFEQGKTDILIGTQMVSKGLDFDHVSIVGILNADTMLNYPDFRSYERAFQLMAQVAGRAGRKNKRGRVILQTKSIDHPIIHQVIANDYEDMVGGQLAERQMFHYPPYYRLVYVYLKNHNESLLDQMAAVMAGKLRAVFGNRVLGPDKPPVARIQTLFIKKIVVKIEQNAPMGRARELLLRIQREMIEDERYKSLIVYYDVDPM